MGLPAKDERYTYADYLSWGNKFKGELIEGIPYAMAGTSRLHQDARGEMERQFRNHLIGKTFQIFSENFDVRLNHTEKDDTVVQPDIIVVCDPSKISDKSCDGAPDLVVEVLSRSTSKKDRITKLQLYEKAGVQEYWIVDPFNRCATVYILEDNKYGLAAKTYEATDTIPVHVLKDCNIDLTTVFEDIEIET